LVAGLGIRWIVVGHDFHFAREREGESALLRKLGEQLGFGVDTVPPVFVHGERVSSTLIRAALAEGSLSRAAEFLGAPYHISGKVMRGQQLGRTLGFPTVNLRPRRRVLPLMGIFAVRVTGAGLHDAPAVASLGTRPTVNGKEPLLEAFIFDYAGDLYGKHLRIDFIARLRDELRFPSLDELVIQMREDEAQAKRILGV
jgi:riboflavin kinase/FMN adenylyltransferase